MAFPLEDADTGREHVTDGDEQCWCDPEVITVEAAEEIAKIEAQWDANGSSTCGYNDKDKA